jgi:hypothetical protein
MWGSFYSTRSTAARSGGRRSESVRGLLEKRAHRGAFVQVAQPFNQAALGCGTGYGTTG